MSDGTRYAARYFDGKTARAQDVSIALTEEGIAIYRQTGILLATWAWGNIVLAERPRRAQWAGIWIAGGGIVLFFWPLRDIGGSIIGWAAALAGLLANSAAAILGRYINRHAKISPLVITLVSMGCGAIILLIGGFSLQGVPVLPLHSWLIIIWLALVNTAVAFTLWNFTLQILTAFESSMINNSMAVQIPILAIIFLGERLTMRGGLGLTITIIGIFMVQIFQKRTNEQRGRR